LIIEACALHNKLRGSGREEKTIRAIRKILSVFFIAAILTVKPYGSLLDYDKPKKKDLKRKKKWLRLRGLFPMVAGSSRAV
jgi:hypothetical protein